MIEPFLAVNNYPVITHYVKVYPSFTRLYSYSTPYPMPPSGMSDQNRKSNYSTFEDNPGAIYRRFMQNIESLRRTKTMISDITLSNDFDMFATFTFNCSTCDMGCLNKPCICGDKCKRFIPSHIKGIMSIWLKNQKKIRGNFAYLIVPEYHKDGKAIHFHALLKDYKGKIKFTGKIKKGRKVFNISSYRAGYSTLVKIDNIQKVSSYIKKYITKEMPKFEGQKRYWCSTGLQRPDKILNPVLSPKERKLFEDAYTFNNLTISSTTVRIPSLINHRRIQKWMMEKSLALITLSSQSISLPESLKKAVDLTKLSSFILMMDGTLKCSHASMLKWKL